VKKIIGRAVWLLLIIISGYFLYGYVRNRVDFQEFLQGPPKRREIIEQLPQNSSTFDPLLIEAGFEVDIFADLKGESPRVLAFDSNQVLVVSLTKEGRIVALPDEDGNGKADKVVQILDGLNKPHGIVFYGSRLFVAETNKVVSYDYDPNNFSVSFPQVLLLLPSGGRHSTRTIKIHDRKLYISVGSSCDTCIEKNAQRASILVSDLDGSGLRSFATGLRNTVFFAFDRAGKLWGNDMGRDFLGDDLPPDELNVVQAGGDYGWPYCYGNRTRDEKFQKEKKLAYCIDTEVPVVNYPAHVAPLGLTFIDSPLFSEADQDDLLVAFHGSWNRGEPVGYKIVKVSIFADQVIDVQDFISGWLSGSDVLGRPVDLVFSDNGELYISDDASNVIYRVSRN